MTAATDAFDALYASVEDARCQVRIGREVIAEALCSGLDVIRENTDLGQVGTVKATVRLLSADEPEGGIANGTLIEIQQNGATDWVKARSGARYTVGGTTRLTLEAVNE